MPKMLSGGLVVEIPDDRLYSEYHVWVMLGTDFVVLGLTDYALEQLGAVDFIELPAPQTEVIRDSAFALVETSKAVTELVTPVSGEITHVNHLLAESPEILSADPYGEGWFVRVRVSDPFEIEDLMSATKYGSLIARGA
jgi:glycine cleavage system H protein